MDPRQRIRQFVNAVTAQVTPDEIAWLSTLLSPKEQGFFSMLPVHEQKHAIRTTQTIQKLSEGMADVKQAVLLKAALLHDIGKIAGKFSPFTKALLVLTRAFFPSLYNTLAEKGGLPYAFPFIKKFYFHKYHTAIGAQLLREAGSDPAVIRLIEQYDTASRPEASLELKILKEADDLN